MLSGVSRTALITLRARADEHARSDRFFADPCSADWLDRLGWPSDLDASYTPWAQAKTVVRVDQIDHLVLDLIEAKKASLVVELGCGLSSRYDRIGARLGCRWIDLDLPAVIALRTSLGIQGANHRHLACSVLDIAWCDEITGVAPEEIIFVAEGLLYYLPEGEVRSLLRELRARFPGATLIFDVIGALDYGRSLAQSKAAGAPIAWGLSMPFERAMNDLGLEVIAGLEPDRVLRETIARYGARFGPIVRFSLECAARIGPLSSRRSGIMVGKLMGSSSHDRSG